MKRKRDGVSQNKTVKRQRRDAMYMALPKGRPARANYQTVARTRGAYASGEMKYYETEKAATAIPNSATWAGTVLDPAPLTLFAPSVGSAITQRIGKEAKVLKIRVRGVINCPAQINQIAADDPSNIRIMLVQDTQSNAAQMTGTNLMTAGVTALTAPFQYQNIDGFGRYRVIKDKFFTIQPPPITWDGANLEQAGATRIFKFSYKPKEPISVRFNSTNGGTIADIVDNSFHVVAIADLVSLAPTINYVCRVNFKE